MFQVNEYLEELNEKGRRILELESQVNSSSSSATGFASKVVELVSLYFLLPYVIQCYCVDILHMFRYDP